MTASSGCLYFDGAADRRWAVPFTAIGGLPIAVIDRAKSAQLMIDTALSRRGARQPPLIFSSANGQVVSTCARHSHIRDLFLDSDLIHADGMPLVFVSRLFRKALLPERVCTTDLFHDVAAVAPRREARLFSRRGQIRCGYGDTARTLYPNSTLSAAAAGICVVKATKNALSISSTTRNRTFSGSVSAFPTNNRLRCAITAGSLASG